MEGTPRGRGADDRAAAGRGDGTGAERRPVLPGFREMAQRMADDREQAVLRRRALLRALADRRQTLGLSQTQVAALMRTSQSAVARLEQGDVDVRLSTLERYAAALDAEIDWRLEPGGPTTGVTGVTGVTGGTGGTTARGERSGGP